MVPLLLYGRRRTVPVAAGLQPESTHPMLPHLPTRVPPGLARWASQRVGALGVVLSGILAAGATPLAGQRLNIREYTRAEGLPQGQVYSVHQDRRGYIWVATNAGAARYDGRRFHRVTADDGLRYNNVVVIEDAYPSGLIMVAGEAVCLWRDGVVGCVGKEEGLDLGQTRAALADPDGSIWVAADLGVALVHDGRTVRTFDEGDGLPSASVQALALDAEGAVWAGTAAGLAHYDRPSGRWIGEAVAGRQSAVFALAADSAGLLVGGTLGLHRRSAEGYQTVPLGEDVVVRHIERSGDGTVWVGGLRRIVRLGNGEVTTYTRANGLPGQDLWDMLVDREGNVWLGSDEGLAKLVPGPFELYTEAEGLPHPFVRAVVEDPSGRLWFGTRDGLSYWAGGHIAEAPFRGLVPDARVYAIAVAPEGGLLVGTGGGVVHRSPSGALRSFGVDDGLPFEHVRALLPDREGGVWIGTSRGLARWRAGTITAVDAPELREAPVLSLAQDADARLWIGLGAGGVLVMEGDDIRRVGAAEGLSDQAVWSLSADEDGGMWVGTNGDGAFHVTDDGVRAYTTADGLGDDFVWQIFVDSDHRQAVWMFTGNGLNRLDGDEMTYFGAADGLEDLEGSAGAVLESSAGDLWFGVGSGVYRYRRNLDREAPPPPPVALESASLAGEPLLDDPIVLPPRPGVVSFRFSTPAYRNEAGIRYRYRLANRGDPWSEPDEDPAVTFAGLPAGTYSLEVVAETDRGVRARDVTEVSFVVEAALWERVWVKVLLALLGIGAMVGAVAFRGRYLAAERRRLEEVVRLRTSEIREKNQRLEREVREKEEAERTQRQLQSQLWEAKKMEVVGRLAGGVAHDFNNLLTSVLGNADLLARDAPPGSDLAQGLEEIKVAARRGAELISQLLAFSRRQVVTRSRMDVVAATREALSVVERVLSARTDLSLQLPDFPLWVEGDEHQMGQVVVNLCMNAIDAMPTGGALTVGVSAHETDGREVSAFDERVPAGRYVCVRVADTGVGMGPDLLEKAFEPFFTTKAVGEGSGLGLASVYGTIQHMGGFIQVTSEPGRGTEIRVLLPEHAEAGRDDDAEPAGNGLV